MARFGFAAAVMVSLAAVALLLLACEANASAVERPKDEKALKKLLRTRNSVLVLAVNKKSAKKDLQRVLDDVADEIVGVGTVAIVDCSTSEGKKTCRKMKMKPSPFVLKHYLKGSFNKDYDRKLAKKSILRFMQDPTGDTPWDEVDEAQDVLHLNDKTFAKHLQRKTDMLVMFYAPWCGHCKALKPKYQEAATELKQLGVKRRLAALDANAPEGRMTGPQYGVKGFPTLLYFENGELRTAYEGKREKDAIVAFMQNPDKAPAATAPEPETTWEDEPSDVVHITGQNAFSERLAQEDSALVMFYAPWCGHCKAFKGPFTEAAAEVKAKGHGTLVAVDCTKPENRDVCGEYDVKGFPTVKHFVKGSVNKDYPNARTKQGVLDFMADPNAPPPPPPPAEVPWSETDTDVVHLTGPTFEAATKKKKHALVFFYAPWCGHCKRAKPEMDKAAATLKDNRKVMFAAVDCTAPENDDLCSENDVSGFPTIKYFKFGKVKDEYKGARTAEGFVEYMRDPDNRPPPPAPPKPFSQEAPQVDHLTAASFDDHIKSHDHTLVFFFAPWCGHCKKAKPEVAAAADRLASKNTLSMAAVDCTVETPLCSRFSIRGYPTIKHFKRGDTDGTDYRGGRSAESFVNFLQNANKEEL
ncbi:hypothetical protein PTSG_09710 [Salpingoeca rosetta]|uniref:Thioredoxin domain-containing protein n=1 Tax=Salpingoeca rosetta (strain ATCC 50818 / BSB-021) TaxID=946362 RepID=F2UNT9_SALR5|nr:uncharacterized protein PTSG_09710 [Salpingoeca rosetta]EGD79294.1 hypothetical protein PTSG_09710 [Salpingoeca rosetta]|eukprot:XP_004989065.1 hypothetical protein PTSG_09710 [Salpingoeca rosetta]